MNILIGLELVLLACMSIIVVCYGEFTFSEGIWLVFKIVSCASIAGLAIGILVREVKI